MALVLEIKLLGISWQSSSLSSASSFVSSFLPYFPPHPVASSWGLPSPPHLPPRLLSIFWMQDLEWPRWLLSAILDQMSVVRNHTSGVSATNLRKSIWPHLALGTCIQGHDDVNPATSVYLSCGSFCRPGTVATPMVSFLPCRNSKRNTTDLYLFPYEEAGTEKD